MWITKFASCILSLLSMAFAAVTYGGVNEGGGSFAPGILPGEFGVTYEFINYTNTQYFLDNGVNVFRITLLLERMCPPATGLGRTFNETYYDEFIDALNFITNGGGYVIIDPHNYMRYNGDNVIGDPNNPNSATAQQFADFWAEMASRVINNAKVIFGIMNEPHDMSTELLLSVDQAAVNGIRSTGANQLILVPGNAYTSASGWNVTPCNSCTPTSEVLGNITDPANNFAFDMHQYFDSDGSGTSDQCVSETIGTERLADATAWLQQNNFKAFLSEFGAGSNDVCFNCVNNVLDYLNENDVWIGWSYWAAGPQWGDYFQSIEPYQGPEFTTTWPSCLKPHLP